MELILCGHEDRYAVEQLCLSLFPQGTEGKAVSTLHRGKTWLTAVTTITIGENCEKNIRRLRASTETVPLRRQLLQQSFYLAALPHLQKVPVWGALAGVRPTKLTTRMLLQGLSPEEAAKKMEKDYFVTPERAKLAVDCSLSTKAFTEKLTPNDISLYVGIPFCPTRCAYCSFVSRTTGRSGDLLGPYLDALEQEIALTGKLLANSPFRLRTLYIGGGTPTTLSAGQLTRLITALKAHLDLSECLEFTVEGGRPDTLDLEKLQTLRALGVDRMSINPQSLQDPVLKACGRPHTAADIFRAYDQAVQAGFADINMDLIAGLPQDNFEGFRRSLDKCLELGADDITIHTLALKKGSRILMEGLSIPDGAAVQAMLDYAAPAPRAAGFVPYYLYRQKYMSGSFENVGWSRPGGECWYNVDIMSELCSILSFGAGGSTKMVEPGTNHIERVFNLKYPKEYTERPEKIQQNQAAFAEFYQKYVPET